MKNPTTIYSKTVIVFFCLLIFFMPMARGSVEPWTKAVFQMLTCLSWIMLIIENQILGRKIQFQSPLNKPLIALSFLVMISFLTSGHRSAAFEGMTLFLTYAAVYYAFLNAVRTRQEERIIVYMILSTATLISIIGLLKLIGMNPFDWWNYDLAFKGSKGSLTGVYINRNHMAGYMEMAIPLVLVLFMTRNRNLEQKIALAALSAFFFIVQGLTLSRGGWIATAGAMIFLMSILFLKNQFAQKKIIISVVAVTVICSILVLGSGPVINRFLTLQKNDPMDNIEGRLRVWKGAMLQIKGNLIFGTGPGTFQHAYPTYQIPGHAELRRYAHNDYLQLTSELGILFVPVILIFFYQFFRTGIRKLNSQSRQQSGFSLACMTGIVAIMIHSLSDFNLYVPANAFLGVILVAFVTQESINHRKAG